MVWGRENIVDPEAKVALVNHVILVNSPGKNKVGGQVGL